MKKAFAVLACLACGSSVAQATIVTFDDLAAGTIVTSQYSGVTISLLGTSPIAGPRTYALQDTSGVLQSIFGASGNAITPGDDVGGIDAPFYDFQFVFSQPVDQFSLMALDAEESVTASAFLGNTFVSSVAQGTFLGNNVSNVFNGPVYLLELGSIGGPQQFDRVTSFFFLAQCTYLRTLTMGRARPRTFKLMEPKSSQAIASRSP